MSFLSPWSALFAAAVAIPLLLLLYFLRLRRQRLSVPSTLLWEKSYEDLQANAPFQRLRWSALLVIQLLLLLALLLALAQPVVRGEAALSGRVVLLIDQSASMNALLHAEPTGAAQRPARTRLDAAKDIARRMIDDLSRSDTPQQMMIISFAASPQVVSTYESNRSVLLDALNTIAPTDEPADLDAALQLAGAYAGSEAALAQPPDVVLLSDGCIAEPDDSAGYHLRGGNFQFVQVAPDELATAERPSPADNIGIAAFSARRDEEDPARLLVFARLINAAAGPVETVLTLWVNDQAATTIRRTVPPLAEGGEDSFTIPVDVAANAPVTLALRQNHRDDLAADDVAWLTLPAAAGPRLLLVHPNDSPADPFLRELLRALEPQKLDEQSADAFAAIDAQRIDSGELYDLIVFDRVSAMRLPGVASLTFGGVPAPLREAAVESGDPSQLGGQPILSWDRQHPLMRSVSLDTIVFAGFSAFELPAGATALAYGPRGPVIAEVRTRGARHVAVGIQLIKSNWPLHVSSAVFMQNAIDYLTLARTGQTGLSFHPGEPITLRAQPNVNEIAIERLSSPASFSDDNRNPAEGNEAAVMRFTVQPGSPATISSIHRAGLYAARGAASPFDRLAVNVASDVESDIRPQASVKVNAESAPGRATSAAMTRPLWPWLIAAAFALLVLEWLVYCAKHRG